MNKAIFLDKDGTLIPDIPYNVDPQLISLIPGVESGLTLLQEAGFRVVIVSNQPGIAMGYFSEMDLMHAVNHLYNLLAEKNVYPLAFYYCPHATAGGIGEFTCPCRCRKPQPGMLKLAANDFGLSLRESWMIGNIPNDIEAGKRAGCRTILLDNGVKAKAKLKMLSEPDIILKGMMEAAEVILQKE